MKLALMVVLVLVVLVLVIVAVGWSLPVKHRVSRQAHYAVPPARVYEAITTVREFPAWRSKVKSVDIVATSDGKQSFRESGSDGAILYVVDETSSPRHHVTRIADKSLPFGGTWTYDIAPAASGATLRITEDGEVYNPLFRFMSKFVFGHHATIDGFLKDLGKKFGADAVAID